MYLMLAYGAVIFMFMGYGARLYLSLRNIRKSFK